MQSFDGDDAVDLLRTRIGERASDTNAAVLDEFVSWVTEREGDDRVIPVLYAWYQMIEHIDFELADPSSDDIVAVLDTAADQDRETWERALQLFYSAFLRQEKDMDVDIPPQISQ